VAEPRAREFGHPLIVVFGVEMNGTCFHGRALTSAAHNGTEKKNWERPGNVRAAYRYVVDRVRARARQYQVDVSHQQLSLSVRNLELWRLPIIPVGLRRLAGPEAFTGSNTRTPNPIIPSLVSWRMRKCPGSITLSQS